MWPRLMTRLRSPAAQRLWLLQVESEVWGRWWQDFAYVLPQAFLPPLSVPTTLLKLGAVSPGSPGELNTQC